MSIIGSYSMETHKWICFIKGGQVRPTDDKSDDHLPEKKIELFSLMTQIFLMKKYIR